MSLSQRDVDEVIRGIARRDARYRPEAYRFVFEALDHTYQLKGVRPPKQVHVSGQELCEGVRDLAIKKFGPLARTVFRHWGVNRTDDFGRIVFNLIESRLMGKTENDSVEDFHEVYDFEEAFEDIKVEATLT